MLDKFDLLSINQTSAQIKLTEAWKASKDINYPIEMKPKREPLGDGSPRQLRTTTRREMREGGKTVLAEKSFTRDAGKLWNAAPKEIKEGGTIGNAKKKIKQYCKLLPI